MPRLTKKTKGMSEGSGAPGGLAETDHNTGPSYRTRAKKAAWRHGSGASERTISKMIDSSVDTSENRSLEGEGHRNQMVLLQNPNRMRRVAGNDFMLTDCSGHSREEQSTCSYFQDIPLIGKKSVFKICPLQHCQQDARREHGLEVPVRCIGTGKIVEQGQRAETTGKCETDSCSGANVESVKIHQTPIGTLSIKKINSSDVWISRYVAQQPGQHHQASADASESVMEDINNFTVLSVTEQEIPQSQVFGVDDMNVSDDRSYAIDSTLSPLPSFRKAFNMPYDMTRSYDNQVVEGEDSFESSSCGMNRNLPALTVYSSCTVPMVSVNSVCSMPTLPMSSSCPVPEVSVSTVFTAPFVTSSSDCVDEKDAFVLLRNTAFESHSETRETESNIYISYPRDQCRVTSVIGGYREMSILNREDSSLHVNDIGQNCSNGCGDDSMINVVDSDYSHTGVHQLDPNIRFPNKVVWTAQNPKFTVISMLPCGKESNMDSLQNSEVGSSVNLPPDVKQIESSVQEQDYLYVEASDIADVGEYLSNDICHNEADSGMQALNYKGAKYSALGRDEGLRNETESNCTSGGTGDNLGIACTNMVNCTIGQDVGELRLLSQGKSMSALPPTLADLMPEGDGELNDFTSSDQDYTLLPLWPFCGDEENNHGSDNVKPQVSGNVMRTTSSDSTTACAKTTSSEDNFGVSEINDLLDSILQDINEDKSSTQVEQLYESASEETHIEETTEYILRDTSRTRLGVDPSKSESCPNHVLAQVEKGPNKDIVILPPDAPQHPPKPRQDSLQAKCLIPNHSIAGIIPQTVTFKTVPAVQIPAIKNVASAHRLSMQPITATTTTITTKQSQHQENLNYVKILPKSSSDSCSTKNHGKMSHYRPSTFLSALPTKSSCHVSSEKEMILPVGETGINITIPKSTPVSIASFVFPKRHDITTKTVPDHMWPGVESTPEGGNTVLLQTTNTLATVSNELCLNMKKADITPPITKLSKMPIFATATGELMPLLSPGSLVLLTPVSKQLFLMHSIPENSLVCNTNASPESNHGAQATRNAGRKCYSRNAVHPFAMEREKIESTTCSPQICTTSVLRSSSCASSSTIQTMAPIQTSAKTKTVADTQKHKPRKKPYFDSVKTRKLLLEDLKELLPDFSDSILAILDLPPSAIRRSFLYMEEVKALHNQALGIQLDMLYKDHVCYCTSDTCLTCVAFYDQKAALSEAKRKVHVPEIEKTDDKRNNLSRGKKRKSYDSEDENKLLFSSPSPQPVNKKNNKWDESVDQKKVHLSNTVKETNEIHFILPEKSYQMWGKPRMKRSKSDTSLQETKSSQTEAVREHLRYSFDDSCHTPHCLPLTPSRTPPRHSCSSTLRRWKELANRKEVSQKTKCHTYSLRSDQWASLARATLADFKLKKKLDKDHVPYSEGQEGGRSRTVHGSLTLDPIIVDIVSFTVGTHDLSGKGEPLYCSKLYICFQDRKLVYVLSARKQTVSCSARKVSPRVKNRVKEALLKYAQHSGTSPPTQSEASLHPFIFIAVPFDSLLSFNITFKRLVVVVDALPSICLMTWKEGCWLTLPRNHPLTSTFQSHLALTKALLAVFPMHQLVLRGRQGEALQRNLARSSVWFRRILNQPSPIQGNHIPSWALPSPAVPGDPCPSVLPATPFRASTTLLSSPSCTSALTSTFISTSTLSSTTARVRSANSLCTLITIPEAGQCSEETQQGTSQQLQPLTSSMACGAGAILSSSAHSTEAPIASTVKSVLQDEGSRYALPISRPTEYPPNLSQMEGCYCKGMCRTRECPCARAAGVCHPNLSCFCQDCENPLNVLHTFGLDVCLIHKDKCLMQNIYNYNLAGLCGLLVSPVVLPCCGASLELFHIIPGTVACLVCGTPVSYSWCSHHIHLQSLCPRNHCIKCWHCKPVFHTHCQKCKQCTRSVLHGHCEECGTKSK